MSFNLTLLKSISALYFMNIRFLNEQPAKRMLVVVFIGTGLLLMGLRWFFFDINQVLTEDTAWKISLFGQFNTTKNISVINSPKPKPNKHIRVISQKVYHPGFKIIPAVTTSPGRVRVKATASGNSEVIYEYLVQVSQSPLLSAKINTELSTIQRAKYLLPVPGLDLSLPDILLLKDFLSLGVNSKPEITHKIFQYSSPAMHA